MEPAFKLNAEEDFPTLAGQHQQRSKSTLRNEGFRTPRRSRPENSAVVERGSYTPGRARTPGQVRVGGAEDGGVETSRKQQYLQRSVSDKLLPQERSDSVSKRYVPPPARQPMRADPPAAAGENSERRCRSGSIKSNRARSGSGRPQSSGRMRSGEPSAARSRQAAVVADLSSVTHNVVNLAMQARTSVHPELLAAFASEHKKLIEILRLGQPADCDLAAAATFHLLANLPTAVIPVQFVGQAAAPCAAPAEAPVDPKPRKPKEYKVINPRSGEEVVIKSTVPFQQKNKKLRIMDPRTGEEVLPKTSPVKEKEVNDSEEAAEDTDATCCAGSPPGLDVTVAAPLRSESSQGSTTTGRRSSGGREDSCPPALRKARPSIVGRAVCAGANWALEPASGGHWDWPMSRQEKKDRLLLLSQLDLLSEIDRLRERD